MPKSRINPAIGLDFGSPVFRLDHAPERTTNERVQGQPRLATAKIYCVSAPLGRTHERYA